MLIRMMVALILLGTAAANAQDRMPPIPADKLTDAQKSSIAELKAARGTDEVTGPFVPMLRSPEVMNRARAMGDYLRFKSALPPKLSEFVILFTSRQWTQQYEWQAHYGPALKAGIAPATIAAIAEGRRPSGMSSDEEILYDFCDELHRNKSVSDATYAKLLARFGDRGVIDTAGIVGYYTFLAIVMNTTQTAAEGDAPRLPVFPR
jgi:4-carboxymuconolactone decarboxylase